MNKEYKSLENFKKDLNSEFEFADIASLMGWLDRDDIKSGKIRCPFHHNGTERTPSCQIGDHFFKCYGCDAKGDIFTFGSKIENKSFFEIITEIASNLNITLDVSGKFSEELKIKKTIIANWNSYKENLKKCERTDVKDRVKKLFPLECGYDTRYNRVVIPFTDQNGMPVGFTKRALGNEEPKWIHDNFNNSLIRYYGTIVNCKATSYEEVFITEGPGDVAGMLRAGYQNTICVCGTTHFNKETYNLLVNKYHLKAFNFMYDNDEAGRKASKNSCIELVNQDYLIALHSNVCLLKGPNKDPGDSLKEDIDNAVNNKIPVIKYFLENTDDNELRDIFQKNKTKNIGIEIINYFMEKYDVPKWRALNMLNSSLKEFNEIINNSICNSDFNYDNLTGLNNNQQTSLKRRKG